MVGLAGGARRASHDSCSGTGEAGRCGFIPKVSPSLLPPEALPRQISDKFSRRRVAGLAWEEQMERVNMFCANCSRMRCTCLKRGFRVE